MHNRMGRREGRKLRPGPDSPHSGEHCQPLSHRIHLCLGPCTQDWGCAGCRTVPYTSNMRNVRPDSDSPYPKKGGHPLTRALQPHTGPPSHAQSAWHWWAATTNTHTSRGAGPGIGARGWGVTGSTSKGPRALPGPPTPQPQHYQAQPHLALGHSGSRVNVNNPKMHRSTVRWGPWL